MDKPGVIQLRKTNLLVKNFNNALATNLRIYYVYLNAQITACSKRFRTDDVTSNKSLLAQNDFELMTSLQTCKENKNAQLLQLKHNCRMPIFNN